MNALVARTLLTTLLAIYRPPARVRPCLERTAEQIATAAADAQDHRGVPAEILLAVGWAETHLGCDAGEGGNWGAPISRSRRHTAGTPDHAARALAWGYRRCHDWPGAVAHFRCGMCRCPRLAGYGPATVMRIAGRLRAGPAVTP